MDDNSLNDDHKDPDPPNQSLNKPTIKSKVDSKLEDNDDKKEDDIPKDVLLDQLDAALKRYFESQSREYDHSFKNWCDENEFIEDETLNEEIEMDIENSGIPEYLDDEDDFPFPSSETPDTEEAKKQWFLDLLRRIRKDPDCSFALPKSSAKCDDDEKDSRSKPRGPSYRPINERHFDSGASLKNFDGTLFRDITKEDIRKLIKKYKDQVPSLCEKQLLTDYTLLQILAVGHKHHIPYLSMLSDDYMRCRVKVVIESDRVKDLTVAEWADPETHPHFRKLKDLKVRVTKKANVHEFMPHHELVKSAVDCYHNRIAKRFDFSPQCKIYNSMEIVVEYMVHHINFVHGKLRDIDADQNAVGTFQVDLCLILGPARSEDPEVDYSFSEDDPDADPVYGMDPMMDDVKDPEDNEHPGDIGAKLAKRGIPYYSMKHGDGNRFKGSESSDIVPRMSMHRHGYKMLYNDSDNGPESVQSAHSFVYQKRAVLTADLTDFQSMHSVEQREGEKVWMYLPGGIGPVIPRDAVPEWGFGSTSEMIVPGIGANKDCDGSLLTLTIQVWQKNEVKAYLFWNGKVMRFMPEDIRSVLPIIFNMDYPGNRAFAQSEKAINGYIERIQPALVDVQFDLFRSDK